MVTDAELQAADRRGKQMRRTVPHAISAKYDVLLQRVRVVLSSDLEILIDPVKTEALEHATVEQMSNIEIWAAGWELYFPLLDEGIWIPHALKGNFGSPRWRARHVNQTAICPGRLAA